MNPGGAFKATSVVKAKDGLRARDSGTWGRTKLEFLDYYCPAAIQATEKRHLLPLL